MNEQLKLHAEAQASQDLSRRDFVAISVAAGLAGGTATGAAAALPVTTDEVMIKTPEGSCDAAFIHPASGAHAAVVLWPDAFGLRPSMREMGKRLAAEGYAVLVPNPFYRVAKAPVFETAANANFKDPALWEKLKPLMGSVQAAGAAERDAAAFVAFLDAQPQVDKKKKIGTQGYCMGGALVLRTAAAVPGRVGAGASFHGGGLVTDKPDSPHLLAPKIQARVLLAIARNDDEKQPDAKDKLKSAFADGRFAAQVEVYPALHGWCVPDMPVEGGQAIYNQAEAERAWAALLSLYKTALA
ncbi:dienelactone hydrolase family protein [Ideonella sp.]|uniref:dienelactone hydrolase family protein n=1 Tax=Ideonella sp. TaxID=1929293 RepID=UPI002B473101|nr:dienelactone hydrolase family protein [Ideonella sp.]HJV71314.1 dienelactone hydrolase family protein [Ideonella sp.]